MQGEKPIRVRLPFKPDRRKMLAGVPYAAKQCWERDLRKLALLAAFTIALAAPASARQVCNHDPVCQAKRDGTSVESKVRAEAQRRAQRDRVPRAVRGDCRMRGTC